MLTVELKKGSEMVKKTEEKQLDKNFHLSNTSSMDLRGRQSVRATFRLSGTCIDAITVLSAQLGIKQKSVFDHLMEDVQVLKDMARELAKIELDLDQRIQKTFVISRRSLSFLDSISKEYDAPRDALVEYSVRRLLPIISRERKRHEKRKKLLAEISNHFAEGKKLLAKAEEMLGTDEAIVHKLRTAMSVYKNAYEDIASFIERGKIIEEFQLD
jgi:cob(I)alamin adenosyltransferase